MFKKGGEEKLRHLPNHFWYTDSERSCLQFQLLTTDTTQYLGSKLNEFNTNLDDEDGGKTDDILGDFYRTATGNLRILVEYQLALSNRTSDIEKTLKDFGSLRYNSLSGLRSVVALTDCAYVCYKDHQYEKAEQLFEEATKLYDENALARILARGEIAYSHRRLGPRHIHKGKLMFADILDNIDEHIDVVKPRNVVEILKAIFQVEFCTLVDRRLNISLILECPEEFDVYSDAHDTDVKKAATIIQNLLDRNVHPILTGRAWAHIIEIAHRYVKAPHVLKKLKPAQFKLKESDILPKKYADIPGALNQFYIEYRESEDKKTLTILGRLLRHDRQIDKRNDKAIEICKRALEFGKQKSCYHQLSIIYRNKAFDDYDNKLRLRFERLALSTERPPPLEVDCRGRIKHLTVPPIEIDSFPRKYNYKYRRIISVPDDENMKLALRYIEQAHQMDVNAITFLKEKAHILSCLSKDLEERFDEIYDLLDKGLKANVFQPKRDCGEVYEMMASLCRKTTKRHDDFRAMYHKAVENMGEMGMLPPVAFPDLRDILHKAAEESNNPHDALRAYEELVDLYDATGQMHKAVAGFLVLALVQTEVKSDKEKLILGRLVTTYVHMYDYRRAMHCLNQLIENCDGLRNSGITAELYWRVRKNNKQFKLVIDEVYPDAAQTPVLLVVSAKDSSREIAQNVGDSIRQLGFTNLLNPQIDGLPGQPNIGQFREPIEQSKMILILFTEEMFADNEIGVVIRECAQMKYHRQVITLFAPGVKEKSAELDRHDAEDIFMICRNFSNVQVPRNAQGYDKFDERFVESILERNRSLVYGVSDL
ncbi:uncharacterized protein LOC141914696 [Tubulanus polymorphus]|uniref:uncharacterized protein LOC141914696 n=1 Tax=Tubulanus polymorphus TaxID=672921 RepID=UPI003DA201F9